MAAVTLAVMVIGPLLGYVGVRAVLDSTSGKDALADNLPVQEFPPTPVGALFTVDADDTLTSATVFVLSPAGVGGSIIPVTVNADIGFADDARRSLQQVYEEEGPEGLVFALESLLLVQLDHWEVADPAATQHVLEPFQPVQVTLPAEVVLRDATDDLEVDSIAAGTAVLDAENAAAVLVSGAGEGDESVRIGNAEAVWAGVAGTIGSGRPAGTTFTGQPTDFGDLFARLVAGPVQSRGLAFLPLSDEQNPSGLDAVQLDQSDAVFVFGSIAPGSMSAPNLGPIMRIEAPPGYDREVKLTLQKILFVGSNVVSVDTNGVARPETVFLVPDESTLLRLGDTDGILGDVIYEVPEFRIDGVDVTLVLGTDYLESQRG